MRTLAMVGLVLATVVAGSVLLDGHRAAAQPIPGATYTGTHSGGGTFSLTVSADGKIVENFEIVDPGAGCPVFFKSVWLRIWGPIVNNSFSVERPALSLNGSFSSAGTAQGTLSFHMEGCVITVTWSVAAPGAAPALPPSPPPPAAQAAPPGAYAQYCSSTQPGAMQVLFLWTPSHQGQQWLDLSLSNNGFVPGAFVSVGPFSADGWGFIWDGLQPGLTHYIRVNTLTPAGWVPSQTLAFTTGVCGGPAVLAEVTQACGAQAGSVGATFRWNASAPPGSVQWLDLSLLDNNFAPGTHLSAGPLGPATTSFAWTGLRPGVVHYWRVNTLTAGGWQPSSTGSFVTASCP